MLRQRQQIAELADRREHRAAQQIDRHPSCKLRKIELHRLRRAREVGDAENRLLPTLRFEFPEKSKNSFCFRDPAGGFAHGRRRGGAA